MTENNNQIAAKPRNMVFIFKRWLFYFIGLIVLALGVSSVIESNVGASAWDAFYVGLSKTVGLTTGTWVIIIGLLVIFLNAFLGKKRPDFPAFITIFTMGVVIDFCTLLIFQSFELVGLGARIALFVLGFILIAVGSGIYLQANFAAHPMDRLMFVLNDKFGLSIGFARLICEATALILGFLLSGPVSYGTVVIALSVGPSIQFAYKKMERFYTRIT
ncbi:YczE/YyaS/YitT family protein [Paenibacillus sp. VT-400]|uniref:YczE/YyaS/YitT family protein n=1 Tax=Paenibacillus sp. VT-400 TaxID=1495853 RepID=UPI00069D6459|nr:membrane protein [Paenibacillus sp. VT-400]